MSTLRFPLLHTLRPHQWIKNLAVFFPLVLCERTALVPSLRMSALAFVIFSGAASSVYIFNDLLDAKKDRSHNIKSKRPIATGAVPLHHALAMILILLVGVIFLGWKFGAIIPLSLYLAGNIFYTLVGKKLFLVDISLISFFFLLRVKLGADLANVLINGHLTLLILIYFFGLAALKRYIEVSSSEMIHRPYEKKHQTLLSVLSLSGPTISLVLFTAYILQPEIGSHFQNPHYLFLLPILAFAGYIRLYSKALKFRLPEDLSAFLVKDIFSWLILGGCVAARILAH
ncbi:MAG: UbiA family prenyltransferase [Bdellovibrionota bacterium]